MTNVLLIDDCADMREMMTEMLEEAGYHVFQAESSEQADEICAIISFALILCDLVMPVSELSELEDSGGSAMAGVHTVHRLANRFPTVPIIAISGELIGDPLQTMQQFGARAVLSKPFGRDELLRAVDGALSGRA